MLHRHVRVKNQSSGGNGASLDLIGRRLRDAWRDLIASPLPARMRSLIDELRRSEDRTAKERTRRKERE